MISDLPTRLQTHIRFRDAHHASPEELALLGEAAAVAVERDTLKTALDAWVAAHRLHSQQGTRRTQGQLRHTEKVLRGLHDG